MKTLVIGQIHDSGLLDVLKEEKEEVIAMLLDILTVQLRKAWKWIIVPLSIDIEISDKNWYQKKEIEI